MKNKNENTVQDRIENVQRMVIWLPPGVIRRMDGWLVDDNSKNRSEFITKALRFYMGHLSAEDQTEFLSDALLGVTRGMIEANTTRICRMLFKLCVEIGMVVHTVAAHFGADKIDQRGLRAYVVDEVKHTNGCISFDGALKQQRKLPEYFEEDYDE